MHISSPSFKNLETIPSEFTCNGKNINPPLKFTDIPPQTKSLLLIVDDPDAPMGTWVHWVVYNINPQIKIIKENTVPQGGIEATTTFGKPGYGGPCPPSGTHHYYFKLYALDIILPSNTKATKESIINKAQKHIIEQAELIGLYQNN